MDICDLCYIPSFGGPSSLILCGSRGEHQLLHCIPRSRGEHATRLGQSELCLSDCWGQFRLELAAFLWPQWLVHGWIYYISWTDQSYQNGIFFSVTLTDKYDVDWANLWAILPSQMKVSLFLEKMSSICKEKQNWESSNHSIWVSRYSHTWRCSSSLCCLI